MTPRRRLVGKDRLPSSDSDFVDVDLEQGYHAETLQDQSSRLTSYLASKTELMNIDLNQPDPPKEIRYEKESSGLKYWVQEIATANEHGGDYKYRVQTAIRAALGSLLTFACIVLPEQDILGAVCIGNIWMHCNLKESFGESLTSVLGFAKSLILTTILAWPFAYFLNHLDDVASAILLPSIVFVLSFIIMSCPHLSSGNLMLVAMYIVVAAPMGNHMVWWRPFGWLATYTISLAVALLMNAFPLPNFENKRSHKNLKRLEKDLTMLLLACKTYSDNNGTNLKLARSAISTIEFMYTRISTTVAQLKKTLPATKVELEWMCKGQAAKDLEDWIQHADKLLKPLKMLRSSLMQRVLGEESNTYSEVLREAKVVLNEEISPSRDRLVSAMIAAVAVCHAWADPSEHRTVLPDVHGELKDSLEVCREAFHVAMDKAAKKLGDAPQKNVPLFAHLTRRMSSFSALFALGDSLLDYLEAHSWENEEITSDDVQRGCLDGFVDWCRGTWAVLEKQWYWYNKDKLRLALKTSVGMVFASLFVCVPFLSDLAAPYNVWPGITIASVNLANTGSSFQKASNRLFATLIAAAVSMIVSDLFPGHNHAVKLTTITIFTFGVVYLRTAEHAYMYTYSAISLGCMLYGSAKTEYDVAGYIPKRIELIFIGIFIFTVVELLMFPRSSRKMVEGLSFQYFLTMRNFMKQAVKCSKRMEEYVVETKKEVTSDYTKLMFDENDDPFQLKELARLHAKLKAQSEKLKKEIDPAIIEPSAGLSLSLHPESFRGLVVNQANCETQAALLLNILSRLSGYYREEGHPIRESTWPHVHTQFLQDTSDQTELVCEWLKTVFPDGRVRPQQGSSVKAVTAVSSFRSMEDVRLKIISGWSSNFQEFVANNGFEGSDPISIMTLGITTTVILEICRSMQKAGKNLEEIAYRFPSFK